MDCSPPASSVYGDSPGKNAGVGCHALLQMKAPKSSQMYVDTHIHTPHCIRNPFLFFPVFLPENAVRYETQLNKPAISELIKQKTQQFRNFQIQILLHQLMLRGVFAFKI